jgi:hypothetical protein
MDSDQNNNKDTKNDITNVNEKQNNKKRKTQKNDESLSTPIKETKNSNNLQTDFNNTELDTTDVFAIFNDLSNNSNVQTLNSSPYIGKQTIVDVCKVLTTTIGGSVMIGFIVSNFYGGRYYLNDTIPKPTLLLYPKNIEQLCLDTVKFPNKGDIAYLFNKNNRPCVIVSSLPIVKNKFYMEPITETLNNLISQFEGKPDPENTGKLFKFNFLPDFQLNTLQRKNCFANICNKITLPERLTYAYQTVMEKDNEQMMLNDI